VPDAFLVGGADTLFAVLRAALMIADGVSVHLYRVL
jgi:hypothetical protein